EALAEQEARKAAAERKRLERRAASEGGDTRLTGRGLVAARIGWLAVALATVGLFLASVPTYFAHLQTACPPDLCASDSFTPDVLLALQVLGICRGFLAACSVALGVAFAAVYAVVAALIFWRRSADRMGLFVSLALLTFGMATFPAIMDALTRVYPAWR